MRLDCDDGVLYIRLTDLPVARTESVNDLCFVDYAADGTIVGIEFTGVHNGPVSEEENQEDGS